MRVIFVLPSESNVPIGGYKVVYEYANALVARGHEAAVVLPKLMHARTGPVGEVRNRLWPHLHRHRNPGVVTWFKLDPRVQIVLCADLREKWLPSADFVFATSWRTAPLVAGYSGRLGRKMYLIQQLETFDGTYEEVITTWKLPLHKIVIAKWLRDLAESLREPSSYIPNGINFEEYSLDRPIQGRKPRVAALYHSDYVKACWDGINALELAKEQFPELSAVYFGVRAPREALPSWIEYVRAPLAPQLRQIYNEASIFLHPSWSEGWPLPPAEAMACGAAVVAAANPGVMDYLIPGKTALTARPKYWTELADALIGLLDDDQRRIDVAEAGHADIQQYTWDRATTSFIEALKSAD